MLRISNGLGEPGPVNWDLALCLLLAWIICYLCVCKGVKSSGKVSNHKAENLLFRRSRGWQAFKRSEKGNLSKKRKTRKQWRHCMRSIFPPPRVPEFPHLFPFTTATHGTLPAPATHAALKRMDLSGSTVWGMFNAQPSWRMLSISAFSLAG